MSAHFPDTAAAEAALEALLSELRDDDGNLLPPVTPAPGAARAAIERFVAECTAQPPSSIAPPEPDKSTVSTKRRK